MNPAIRRSALLMLFGFLSLIAGLVYWQIVRSQSLDDAPSNPRVLEASLHQQRGSILGAGGQVLAHSVQQPDGSEKRIYATPSLAQTIGYISTTYGLSGLEQTYNDYLSGQKGSGPLGAIWNDITRQPAPGNDLVLTIDPNLQAIAARALGDRKGAVVALDPSTGAIKALVSSPSYDPNQIEAQGAALLKDPNDPLLNRATQGLYPPGSIYKTITATAALDSGVVKPSDSYGCSGSGITVQGFTIGCENAPPSRTQWDFQTAFAYSINATFAQVALQIGAGRFTEYSRRFGMGEALPFDIDTATTHLLLPGNSLNNQVLLATSGFGQGQLAVTPLQMALVAATVANNGLEPAPYLVAEIHDPNGAIVDQHQPSILGSQISGAPGLCAISLIRSSCGRVMSPETARTMQQFMVGAVKEGFGQEAGWLGMDVAGKSGTAETGINGQSHAWVIGFGPTSAPRIALAVIVENGGAGGVAAGPVAAQIFHAVLGS